MTINRALQNWPDVPELDERQPTVLNPYVHELNREGTACAEDCPACRWVYKQHRASQQSAVQQVQGGGHSHRILFREESKPMKTILLYILLIPSVLCCVWDHIKGGHRERNL